MSTLIEDPLQAAKRLLAIQISKGYTIEKLHPYTNIDGTTSFWKIRLRHPESNEKIIRPLMFDGKNYQLKEPAFENGKLLYLLHLLVKRLNEPVYIVEGEWCAYHLYKKGILATTSGSAQSASKADWQPLAGRHIVVWADNDSAGKKYGESVVEKLLELECKISVINVEALGLPEKGDCVDWLKLHPEATAKEITALPKTEITSNNPAIINNHDRGKRSQSAELVDFVLANLKDLFHDDNKNVYIEDKHSQQVKRLDGRPFKDWLATTYQQATGKVAREQSIKEALSTLAGRGRYHGECRDVFIRTACLNGIYYLDLAEPNTNRVISIEPGKWQLIDKPPVKFVRPDSQHALPTPELGGDISDLWNLVNIPEDARLLVLAWLIESLRPDTPYPVLELIGEHGSAKSTTQRLLRRLIDPNASDLRSIPKTVEDIFVSAGASRMTSYENISHLPATFQDALCILSTGGAHAKRKLYSDADEIVINAKQPVVLNGITAAVTAQDLIDRTISIDLPSITARLEANEIQTIFDSQYGKLLGALLDLFVVALQRLPTIQLSDTDKPRLVEFAKMGMAITEAMGRPGSLFIQQFSANRREVIGRTIDTSPVATAVVSYIDRHPLGKIDTAKVWLDTLSQHPYKPDGCDAWPRTPKGLGDALRRAAPALRQIGIYCRNLPKTGGFPRWQIVSDNEDPAI